MQKRLKHNLDIIRQSKPNLAKIVDSAPDIVALKRAKSGVWWGKAGNISLCGKYDPQREALCFVDGQSITSGMNVLLYGVGMGYHLKPILDAVGPEGVVVVAEANSSILRAMLLTMPDTGFLEDQRLIFVAGENEESFLQNWKEAFHRLDPQNTKIIIHHPSLQALPASYTKVARTMELIEMERRFPLIMGSFEKENFRANLPEVLRSAGINSLRGVLDGDTAIIVGAGPSLDQCIPFIASAQGVAILSSDTAFPVLLKAGIVPDYLFSIDPKRETELHMKLAGRYDIPIILAPTSNAQLVREWAGPKYFGFKSPEKFEEPAKSWAKEMGVFHSGGSVSCIILETAYLMGAGKALLAGLDFGFSGARSYASGTVGNIISEKGDLTTNIYMVDDYFGCEKKSTINLYSYLRECESLVKGSSIPTYTLSPECAVIDGVSPVPAISICLENGDSNRGVKYKQGKPGEANLKVERKFMEWLS